MRSSVVQNAEERKNLQQKCDLRFKPQTGGAFKYLKEVEILVAGAGLEPATLGL